MASGGSLDHFHPHSILARLSWRNQSSVALFSISRFHRRTPQNTAFSHLLNADLLVLFVHQPSAKLLTHCFAFSRPARIGQQNRKQRCPRSGQRTSSRPKVQRGYVPATHGFFVNGINGRLPQRESV